MSNELKAAKESIEEQVLALPGVVGIDIGIRDDETPDFDDLAIRVFVTDISNVPPGVPSQAGGFAVVIRQARIELAQPDDRTYRPVRGGVSSSHTHVTPSPSGGQLADAGTLGAIVRDVAGVAAYGLSNFHVFTPAQGYAAGDEIVQPGPLPVLGFLPGSRIGELRRWAFPEATPDGEVDAALCSLEVPALPEVVDVGRTAGVTQPAIGMHVKKRGRTTRLTEGTVDGINGSYPVPYPGHGTKTMRNQISIRPDAPALSFCESGDSGSVLLSDDDKVVGLVFASYNIGTTIWFGLANPICSVALALGIEFDWPAPRIDDVDTWRLPFHVGTVATIRGYGLLLASRVEFDSIASTYAVVDDTLILASVPQGAGPAVDLVTVTAPGGSASFSPTLGF